MLQGEFMGLYRTISSAYRANLLLCDRGRLQTESIKMVKRRGPRMDSCGTPDVTSQVSAMLNHSRDPCNV